MTKEYFINRLNSHCIELSKYAEQGKTQEAKIMYGRIRELTAIANELGAISMCEYGEAIRQAEDCFYNNL